MKTKHYLLAFVATLALGLAPLFPSRAEAQVAARRTYLTILTPAQATELFNRMAAQRDIAFFFPNDGCYSRAHLMVRRMLAMGILPRKVWAFKNGDLLTVRTPYDPKGYVQWDWHVAPVVRVRYGNGDFDMVIDPSLFNGPATIANWAAAQRLRPQSRPLVCITAIGQRPTYPNGRQALGSYKPNAVDPPNIDADAVNSNAYFKARERRYR